MNIPKFEQGKNTTPPTRAELLRECLENHNQMMAQIPLASVEQVHREMVFLDILKSQIRQDRPKKLKHIYDIFNGDLTRSEVKKALNSLADDGAVEIWQDRVHGVMVTINVEDDGADDE